MPRRGGRSGRGRSARRSGLRRRRPGTRAGGGATVGGGRGRERKACMSAPWCVGGWGTMVVPTTDYLGGDRRRPSAGADLRGLWEVRCCFSTGAQRHRRGGEERR